MPARAIAGRAAAAATDVLVLDPDAVSARRMGRALERAGFAVRTTATATEATRRLAERAADLVVLDVVLPGRDGLQFVSRLRTVHRDRIGVLIVSSRARTADRILGLRLGADDYIAKPCLADEVVARVEAVARRLTLDGATGEPLIAGDVEIHCAQRRVSMAGREVPLARREYDLLVFLARHPGQTFTREQLMERVWGSSHYADTATLSVHVRRLRAKLPARLIETVWGVGYRFATPTAA